VLCIRCGEREAERVILVEGHPSESSPSTPLAERQRRAEELSRLCGRCLIETIYPPEQQARFLAWHAEEQRMAAAAEAETVADALPRLLDAVTREAVREVPDFDVLRDGLIALLQFLITAEGRTHANLWATARQLNGTSDWQHLPPPYLDLLEALSGFTMRSVWRPEETRAMGLLPEQLLERLQTP
jgi:hypothetical protein